MLYGLSLVQARSGVSSIAHLEVDLQREGDASLTAQDEGDQLLELPFTPVHAPVITLGMNVPRWASGGFREEKLHFLCPSKTSMTVCIEVAINKNYQAPNDDWKYLKVFQTISWILDWLFEEQSYPQSCMSKKVKALV